MKSASHKLEVVDLRKTYGAVVAVESANLDVREGEFVTLLGPSGSGKTTLLMMVAGLSWPDSGQVRIDGRNCTYLSSHKRDIGMVFQNYALFPHLSVFENIAFPLRMRRVPEQTINKEVHGALEKVRLPEVGDRLPSALSGGQQQRIALARCIVYKPSIILMDEPLGALDKKLREHMQLEIKALHEQLGITVLYVTHDQEEAMVMSDRICLFNSGRIEQVGPPEEIYFQPRSKFAADFLGESNIFSAQLHGEQDGIATLVLDGQQKVRAPLRDGMRSSKETFLMVRPESIKIAGDAQDSHNSVQGILREKIMTGGVSKYFVEIPGCGVVTANTLTARSLSACKSGDSVRLCWEVADTVMLSADSPDNKAVMDVAV
ncbi:ABC transporter ATP-binding protein [Limibacillus sp. MBR-115]|uniref:ABC transporter ATP-binding protein n=1 Tax=Limibacillus sp. MBR-115 TaxID=3156465 RepID=UPI0033942377